MTSIFELAQFLADRDAAKGNFEPAQIYLDRAARQAVAGWTTLEEAEDDPGTRYDAWGNEIQPGVIYDAVRYLRHAPADNERLRAALQQLFNCVPLSVEGPDPESKIVTSVAYWRAAYDQSRAALLEGGGK